MTPTPQHVLHLLTDAAAGRDEVARLLFCAALAGGHVLLDDLPGTGKTTLAKSLGQALGLTFRRVQCTSDLLPSDILGVSIFDREAQRFVFHEGPIFTQVLLCDELNRCPPRTQSALLEGMAEGQVTVDRDTHALPHPFLVIATQNPVDGRSTLDLPQAEWDRFMFCLSMGRLAPEAEKQLLTDGFWGHTPTVSLPRDHEPVPFETWMAQSQTPRMAPVLVDYLFQLLEASRQQFPERGGLSTRAGQGIVRAARAWAWMAGRDHVILEDVQAVFLPAALHRLLPSDRLTRPEDQQRIRTLMQGVSAPL